MAVALVPNETVVAYLSFRFVDWTTDQWFVDIVEAVQEVQEVESVLVSMISRTDVRQTRWSWNRCEGYSSVW